MWKAIAIWVVVTSTFVAMLAWAAAVAPGFLRVTSDMLVGAVVFIAVGVVFIIHSHRQKRGK